MASSYIFNNKIGGDGGVCICVRASRLCFGGSRFIPSTERNLRIQHRFKGQMHYLTTMRAEVKNTHNLTKRAFYLKRAFLLVQTA